MCHDLQSEWHLISDYRGSLAAEMNSNEPHWTFLVEVKRLSNTSREQYRFYSRVRTKLSDISCCSLHAVMVYAYPYSWL